MSRSVQDLVKNTLSVACATDLLTTISQSLGINKHMKLKHARRAQGERTIKQFTTLTELQRYAL